MCPPSEAGVLDVTEPTVPPRSTSALTWQRHLWESGLGLPETLRPESQVQAHHFHLLPFFMMSQMDIRSVPDRGVEEMKNVTQQEELSDVMLVMAKTVSPAPE